MDESLLNQARDARRQLSSGGPRGGALLDLLVTVPFVERDAFVDELLALGPPPEDGPELLNGAVPYVPCGVDAILAAVREAPVTSRNTFVDLGAGVGRAALLVHLLTGARVRGVEIQPALVDIARSTARALGVDEECARFTVGDAAKRSAADDDIDDDDTDDGAVYFIYASFSPNTLAAVYARLERRARPFSIVTVGFDVVGQPWLRPRPASHAEIALYDAR